MQPKLTPTTNDLNGHGGVTPFVMPKIESFMTSEGEPATPLPQPAKEPQPLKIAIIGTAPSSRHLAPYNDPSWKIWGCSAGNKGMLPRVDCWFEIHSTLLDQENAHYGRDYIDWLNQQTFPVFMQDNSVVSRAQPYPMREAVAEFGDYFFTSSFAWMIAKAIMDGASEIGLWGVDMASKEEYILQRPGGQFFIREAVMRGITVHIPKESDLAQRPPLYGFDDATPFLRKISVREKELKDRVNAMRQQRDQLATNITYLEGALEDIEYVKTVHGGAQSSGLTTNFGRPRCLTNG